MVVTPPREWNRIRARLFDDVRAVEDWTLNGIYLDGISFVAGLKSGAYIVRQDRKEYRQVPKFRSDMTPPEVAAMLESLYRVRGGSVDFKTLALAPRSFMGQPGYQFDFEHLDGDEVWRRGRVVGTTVNDRLYLVLFDATRSHYYDAALPDFEAIAQSARLKGSTTTGLGDDRIGRGRSSRCEARRINSVERPTSSTPRPSIRRWIPTADDRPLSAVTWFPNPWDDPDLYSSPSRCCHSRRR